jgi:hypothetical protein
MRDAYGAGSARRIATAMLDRLLRIRQPWLFVLLAAGGVIIVYAASDGNLVRAVLGGLIFAALISLWLVVRARIWR